ncbi:hypothetical protein LDENG_00060470, partial [Lucifuga dentata]
MGLLTQFTLLLWKNFTLRKRQKVRLVVEVLWPLFLFLILVWVRSTNKPIYKGQCHYPNKAMPSAGVLPWLQGMICNIDNPCMSSPTPGEMPGQVNNFNSSIIAGILIELQTLVVNRLFLSKIQLLVDDVDQWTSILSQSNPTNAQPVTLRNILRDNETFLTHLKENLSVPPTVVQSLMGAKLHFDPMMGIPTADGLRSILCNGTNLDEIVQFSSQAEKEDFQNVTCSLSPQQLTNTQRVFLQNLDARKVLSELPAALDLNPADTAQLMGRTTADALPVIDEVIKLQNLMPFKAASLLDFQQDMIGSFNKLLCGKQSDFNSTNVTLSLPSDGQMPNNMSFSSGNNSSDAFCEAIISILEGTPGLRRIWSIFKPLVQGKVLYTPDTPAARLIVQEANRTYNALAMLKELTDLWDGLRPRVWDFFQNGSQINAIRDLLANPVFAALLNQRLNGTGWTAELLANFLYNGPPEDRPVGMPPYDWRDMYNATTQILQLLSKFLGCLDLNKFEAAATEGHLVSKALELLKNDTYWAGIVFENLQPDSSQPPPYVKYKIRMDIDETERTNKVKDRLWSPGARDNSFNDLRYILGGFAYLQDMMDHGIIRAHTPQSQPLGVFVQQMPYPCYVDDVFIHSIGGVLPMVLVLAFVYTVCMTIKSLVLEKELRLKEVLRAVGIQNGALWSARFTESLVLLTVPCVLISILVK